MKQNNALSLSKTCFPIFTFLILGCSSPSLQQQLNYEANNAYEKSSFNSAKEKYKSALKVAKENNDLQYEAIAAYGLGRSYGYLCNYKKAETWLIKSIALRKNIPNTNIAYLSQNILELGRLYQSRNKFEKAHKAYAKAIPLLESLNIQTQDPIGYANLLERYSQTLQASKQIHQAMKIKKRINGLRLKYSNRSARFKETYYPKNCKK